MCNDARRQDDWTTVAEDNRGLGLMNENVDEVTKRLVGRLGTLRRGVTKILAQPCAWKNYRRGVRMWVGSFKVGSSEAGATAPTTRQTLGKQNLSVRAQGQ